MSYNFQDHIPVFITNGGKKAPQRQNAPGTKQIAKLESNEEICPPNRITPAQAQFLSQSRTAKGIQQKDLAKQMSISVKIIEDYENCKTNNFSKVFYNNLLRRLGVQPPK
jgi:ribosome-binding protein aMBF1 (putative translation factor)